MASKFNVAAYAKAVAAGVAAAAVSISTFVAPASTVGHVITVVLAVLGAYGVFAVKNADKDAPPKA